MKLFKRHYNDERPHSSPATKTDWAITPGEFYEQWSSSNPERKDGFAGGGVMDLSLCTPRAESETKDGPIESIDRPDSPAAIHVGAPVASQQSRILRVDTAMIPEASQAGTFPASNHQPVLKT